MCGVVWCGVWQSDMRLITRVLNELIAKAMQSRNLSDVDELEQRNYDKVRLFS
jgi:hypothetical protein